MNSDFQFTFKKLERQYKAALDGGYEFLTCHDYFLRKTELPPLAVVNRVDIDVSVGKAERLLDIFDRLRIRASFFVRLHANEYNPFSFENYRILKAIRDSGHEIGYHSEIVDQAAIWGEDAADCLRRDIDVLNRMLDIESRKLNISLSQLSSIASTFLVIAIYFLATGAGGGLKTCKKSSSD